METWIEKMIQMESCAGNPKAAALYEMILRTGGKSGDTVLAEKAFKWVKNDPTVKISNWHYNQVLTAYIKKGDLAGASNCLEQFAEEGFQLEVVGCTMFMHA